MGVINIQIIKDSPILKELPPYATTGSAAVDLFACIYEPITLQAGNTVKISSGIRIHIDDPTYVAIVVPRSGLGSKHGIILSNTVGVIDSDYTGVIGLTLWNRSNVDYVINPLDRVAQLMVVPVMRACWVEVDEFSNRTERGDGGFGSTGR